MFLQTLLLILIPLVAPINLSKFHIDTQITEVFTFSSKLIQKYQHHDVVVHVENQSLETTGRILGTYPVVTVLYNHDKSKNLKRPQGAKCINVVTFAKPEDIAEYLSRRDNIHEKDAILFIINDSDFTKIGSLKARLLGVQTLSRFGNVLIFVYYEKKVEVYSLCFYCGKTGQLKLLKETSYKEFFLTDDELFPEKTRDFQGYQLKIAYIEYFPYVFCVKKNTKDRSLCKEVDGVHHELLKTVSKALNFTYQLLEVPNNSYTVLFQGLASEKFDLAIGGLTLTESRKKCAEFSSVINLEPIVLTYIYKPLPWMDLPLGPKPFDTIFRVSFVCFAAIIFLFLRLKCDPLIKTPFWHTYTIVAQIMCEQPVPHLSTIILRKFRWCLYIFFTAFWMYIMTVNVLFKSRLTAAMIHPRPPMVTPPVLVDAGYIMVLDTYMFDTLIPTLSEDEIAIINRSTTITVDNKCDALAYAQTHKAMVLGELATSLLHMRLKCKKLNKNVKFSVITFRQAPHGWAFKVRASFVDLFNVYIKRAMNAGLINEWDNKIRFNKDYNFFDDDLKRKQQSDTFYVLLGQLSLLFILLAVSTACFVMEILYYNISRKKRSK